MVLNSEEMIPVRVECHAGYKADEYPKSFILGEKRYEILEILDRWYQSDSSPEWPVSNYFKVNTGRGGPHILKHDLEKDRWYLCLRTDQGTG